MPHLLQYIQRIKIGVEQDDSGRLTSLRLPFNSAAETELSTIAVSNKGTNLSIGRYAPFNQFGIGGYNVCFGLAYRKLVEMLLKGFDDKY